MSGTAIIENNSYLKRFTESAEKLKATWISLDVKNLEELIKGMTKECTQNPMIFINPVFKRALDGIFWILHRIHRASKEINGVETLQLTILEFLAGQLNEESVRVSLRDHYNLLYFASVYFNTIDKPDEILVLLKIIEAISRDFEMKWKSAEVKSLIRDVYAFMKQNPSASLELSLALKFLVNICSENSSCCLMARKNSQHKDTIILIRGPIKDERRWGIDVLCTHLVFIFEPMFPIATLETGAMFIRSATANALKNCRSLANIEDLQYEAKMTDFLRLSDFMSTFTKKLQLIFSSSNVQSSPAQGMVGRLDQDMNRVTVANCKEKFIQMSRETLENLKAFVQQEETSRIRNKTKVAEHLLKYIVTFIPPCISVLCNIECYKIVLDITQILFNGIAIEVSSIHCACLSTYLRVAEQVFESRDDCLAIRSKLSFEHNYEKVIDRIRLVVDVDPVSVDLNYLSIRLLACLSSCETFSEEANNKLDLGMIGTLVNNLAESQDVMPNVQWQRSVCLIELLATMSKYSRNPQILNQLLAFVTSNPIANQIAICIKNGNEQTIRSAINVVTATAFSENSLTSITKSIKDSNHQIQQENLPREDIGIDSLVSNAALKLDQSLETFSRTYVGDNEMPDIGDLIGWFRIKEQMHEYDLFAANQHANHLNSIIQQLKLLITRQSEIMVDGSSKIFNEKMDSVILQTMQDKTNRDYKKKIASLEKELLNMSAQLEDSKNTIQEIQNALELCRRERDKVEKDRQQEEKLKVVALVTLKEHKDVLKQFKNDYSQTKKKLEDATSKITELEMTLKLKEDECANNAALLEKEKRTVDTIRGLIGNGFDKRLNGK